jgi:hypothetical protein
MIEVPDHLVPAIERMIDVLEKKKHDYAGLDQWRNFRDTSNHFGFPMYESADFNEIQKLSRLRTLRVSDGPVNESVLDTYLDKANFALLAFAMYLDLEDIAPAQDAATDSGYQALGPHGLPGCASSGR